MTECIQSFNHYFIRSFFQQIFIEHLLYVRHWAMYVLGM